jgi:dynein heavy chain
MGWPVTSLPALQDTIDKMNPYQNLYTIITNFQQSHSDWMNGSLLKLNAEQTEENVTGMWRTLYTLGMTFEANPAVYGLVQYIQSEIERFKVHLPLMRALCNPGIRERHWRAISEAVGIQIMPDEYTSLGSLIDQNFENFIEQLEVISATASKEFSFEKALQKMFADWKDVQFGITSYRDTGTYILSAVDDIQTLLDDHIVKTQTMRGSPFIKPFEDETKRWEAKLVTMQEGLDEWLKVQSTWLYLEPIFSSEDIMRQMPQEGKRFQGVNKMWKELMAHVANDAHVLAVFDLENIVGRLRDANGDLELVQKGLNQYLEVKRLFFPRFFFLSNDEMLEILSETRDPLRVQPHLKKCFEGIAALKFEPNQDILGMYSAQKEYIQFDSPISVAAANGAVEKWLVEVEKSMLVCLRRVVAESMVAYQNSSREKWVLEWPGQIVLCVSQIYWTNEVETAITESQEALKKYVETSTERLNKIVDLVRGNLPKLARTTLEALVVIDVHARDVVSKLSQDQVSGITEFGWLSQLRYYFDKDAGVTVKMVNSCLNYGQSCLSIVVVTENNFRL